MRRAARSGSFANSSCSNGVLIGPGQSTERGKRLLMWGYYLQVPESTLASVLVDDQERQQSSSVPFGKVHPQVRAGFESRLADLLPASLFEVAHRVPRVAGWITSRYSPVPHQ